jgi:hypothetical protein
LGHSLPISSSGDGVVVVFPAETRQAAAARPSPSFPAGELLVLSFFFFCCFRSVVHQIGEWSDGDAMVVARR